MVHAGSKVWMHLSALMLTAAPSLGSYSHCSFHYHSLQKDPSCSKHNPKGCITLEQAAVQGHPSGSSPACFPQHNLLTGRLITPVLGKEVTDHLQSKLMEQMSQVPPLSWLPSQLISHHTRCHGARTQATHPPPGPQPLPSSAQQKHENSWVWSKCRQRHLGMRVWQQQGEAQAAPGLHRHQQELTLPFLPAPGRAAEVPHGLLTPILPS